MDYHDFNNFLSNNRNNIKAITHYLIKKILLICNGLIINQVPIYISDYYCINCVLYNQINFKIDNLIKIITSLISLKINYILKDHYVNFFIHTPINNLYTIEFYDNNVISDDKMCSTLILTLYLYTFPIINYSIEHIESSFDCNTIISEYTRTRLLPNISSRFDINYNDISLRILNKTFSYIGDDMKNFMKSIIKYDDNYTYSNKSMYINKINYAIKLIKMKWIMDEYLFRNKSWTINYYDTYKNNLELIKLRHINLNEYNNNINICNICNKYIITNDILINQENIYAHVNCVLLKLMK